MYSFPWLAFVLSTVAIFVFRSIVFSPFCLGKVWVKGVFPSGMPSDAKFGFWLLFLTVGSSAWLAVVSVVVVSLLKEASSVFLVVFLVMGIVKFCGLEQIGFSRRDKGAVAVEMVSTIGGLLLSVIVTMLIMK